MDLRRVFHKIIRLLAYTIRVLAMQQSPPDSLSVLKTFGRYFFDSGYTLLFISLKYITDTNFIKSL